MRNEQKPIISIIIPVKNEGVHIQNTINSLQHSKTTFPIEIIVVNDGSTDKCCNFLENRNGDIKLVNTVGVGSAQARNIGAENSSGDYLIFCDAHLFFEDLLIDKIIKPLIKGTAQAINPAIADASNRVRKGYGYTWNQSLKPTWNTDESIVFSPLLAGGCLGIKRNVFFEIGGFERGFKVWGREDEEISLKLWLMGFKCAIEPTATVLHVFRSKSPPFELTWNDVNYNLMRMAYSHFNRKRIEKCRQLIQFSDPDEIIAQVLKSNVLEQRNKYFSLRVKDDDWFMKTFGIDF